MIWIYRLLFPLAMTAAAPYYLLRMRRRGGYGRGFAHRFGRMPHLPPRRPGIRRVWIQAVSVGEILAVEPIVRALAADGTEVVVTTTTSTGYKLASGKFSSVALGIAYFPIDWAPFSAAAWRRISPDVAVVAEGERWPEHMSQARGRGVPVLCINARLSDRSFRRMRPFPFASRFVLSGISRLLAGSQEDARRFRALGFEGPLEVTGNIKLDVEIPRIGALAQAALRRSLGVPEGSLVLLGSSTWPGEEEALIGALRAARQAGARCALVLVPRHAERGPELASLLSASGLSYHRRSGGDAAGEVDACLADTTGELRTLTQCADLVFVGKSLPPHTEGQTPVEAATMGKAILMGPGMANFREIAGELVRRGAARTVADPAQLSAAAARLLSDAGDREGLARAAAAWRQEVGGGTAKTLAAIRSELSGRN
ncbi:MAG TPA: glycosyltransferase N-terminal domain-containing protein [Opitutaceae bacterium]|jgi:3-deoxy-D-manno-octulosonic-acid transferase